MQFGTAGLAFLEPPDRKRHFRKRVATFPASQTVFHDRRSLSLRPAPLWQVRDSPASLHRPDNDLVNRAATGNLPGWKPRHRPGAMTIRTVLRMGHPVLKKVAAPVERFGEPGLIELVRDLDDTMRELNGAGLAAPQIGISLRVVVFEVALNPRYPDVEPVPHTVLVNPVLEPLGDSMAEDWEGCLSVPGLRGLVPRYMRLRYRGYDLQGQPIDRTVSGFHARVVQHEVDHLDGILYPMRMRDLSSLAFEDVLYPDGLS
jgi:peptide deformylase